MYHMTSLMCLCFADAWTWVMSWLDLIPVHHMTALLLKHFFPKWIQVRVFLVQTLSYSHPVHVDSKYMYMNIVIVWRSVSHIDKPTYVILRFCVLTDTVISYHCSHLALKQT